MLSDLDIAKQAKLAPLSDIAAQLGLTPDDYDHYGSPYVAKLRLNVLDRLKDTAPAKYVDVTAITPTPLGEGKSTTTVGVCQAIGAHLKKNVFTCIRQVGTGQTQLPL